MKEKRLSSALAAAVVCSASFAAAQTTGNLEGRITDTSGAPLPGVSVQASSPRMQGVRIEVSARDGKYRFLAVPPGQYRIEARLEGFDKVAETATVSLDATATLDLTLGLAVREAVTVTGEVPMVDVTSTTTGTNYRSEVMAKLPLGRNYADIALANPGANTDRGNTEGGRRTVLTIYGATSVENQWIVDGVNTTNVLKGYQGKFIKNEIIEEVEVKTGGYQAEYGRALGGIVNVVTKSGGNQFHGDVFAYYDSEDLRAKRIVTEDDIYGGVLTEFDHCSDYGADLGGFILRDTLWFFAAYDRVDKPGAQYNTFSTALVPAGTRFYKDVSDSLYSGKLTWNVNSRSNIVGTAFSDPSQVAGAARGGVFNPSPSTWESRREFGGLDFGLRVNQLLGSVGVLTAQGSRHRDRSELFGARGGYGVRLLDFICEGGTPDRPCTPPNIANSVTGGLGFINGANRNHSHRDQYRLDATLYSTHHEVKVGGEYQKGITTLITSYTGGQLVQRFNEFGQTYYAHLFFANSPTDLTPGPSINEPLSSDIGFYLQDSWKPAPALTVNVGVRWDQQTMKSTVGDTIFKANSEWQPRVGVVWDPTGKGAAKLYASVGRFYYPLPTNMTIFTHGASTFLIHYNFDPVDMSHDPAVIGHESPYVQVTGRAEPVDKGLSGPYQDELTFGLEKLIDPTFSIGVKGTYRRLGRVIEDRCDLDWTAPENRGYSCAITNPGSDARYAGGDFTWCNGLDGRYRECQYGAPPTAPARRVYRGVELLARKTVAQKLWLQASYAFSSLRGNFDGFVNESYGQDIPGWGPDYDYPQFRHNSFGRLYLDRPHSFRLDATYTTPLRLFIGLQGWAQSGAPLDRWGYFSGGYGAFLNLVPRGTAGRLPTLWEANLTVGYPFTVGRVTVTLQAYAFNVFNNQIETGRDINWTNNAPEGYPDSLYDPNVPSDNPDYGKITARQNPRLIRGAIKISF